MIKYGTNNIGSLYFGNNSIGKAYLGSNLVFSKGSSPQPTTYVTYIRGGANGSYIDTGVTADSTTRVVVWARNVNPTLGFLLGASGAGDSRFNIGTGGGPNTGSLQAGFGTTHLIQDAFSYLSNYNKYELSSDGLKVNDKTIISVSSTTFNSAQNIHLFGVNSNGTHYNASIPCDICACKIYKNNVLVRDYRAVSSPSIGLYDSVSGTLFTNSGSGSFTYGTFDFGAYIPLEYIECSGLQYFDSGIKATYSMEIATKFRASNTVPKYHSLFGTRSSSPASSCDISFGSNASNSDNIQLYWRFGENTTANHAFNGSTANKITGKDLVGYKNNATLTVYENGTTVGTATASAATTFETAYTMAIGTLRDSASSYIQEPFFGRIYYMGFSNSGSFIPVIVNGVAGMYETYNDVFYPSISGIDFLAGPENKNHASVGNLLPLGYEQLTYAETPLYSQAYINTGIVATNDTGFEIDAMTYDPISNTDFGCLFGGRAGSNQSDFQLSTYIGSGSSFKGTLRRGSSSQNYDAYITRLVRFQASLSGSTFTVNGSGYTVSSNITDGKAIYLFALNDNGTAAQFGHLRVYRFKLKNGSTVVLDYIPCRRTSDGVVGFYDLVANNFVSPSSGSLLGVSEDTDTFVENGFTWGKGGINTPGQSSGSTNQAMSMVGNPLNKTTNAICLLATNGYGINGVYLSQNQSSPVQVEDGTYMEFNSRLNSITIPTNTWYEISLVRLSGANADTSVGYKSLLVK